MEILEFCGRFEEVSSELGNCCCGDDDVDDDDEGLQLMLQKTKEKKLLKLCKCVREEWSKGEMSVLASAGDTPVVPSRGDDEILEVGVDEHHSRERPPRTAQVHGTAARHLAIHERVATVVRALGPFLRS